jgi:hypothetical protein
MKRRSPPKSEGLRALASFAAVVGGALMWASAASATVWTSQASFDDAFPGLAQVTFSGVITDASPSNDALVVSSPFSWEGVTFTGPALTVLTPDFWPAPFDHLIANIYDSSLTASFAASDEVGLFVAEGFQGTTGPISVTAYDGPTLVYSGDPTVDGLDTFSFIGLSGLGPITSVTLSVSGAQQFPGVGLVEFAGVPEPGAWAMILIGVGAVGGLTRRKARSRPEASAAAAVITA